MPTVGLVVKMNEIVDYVSSTWTHPTNARFHYSIWSRYNIDGPRTNNHVEGWHSGLNKTMSKPHPNIWKFIEVIKKEQKANELKVSII